MGNVYEEKDHTSKLLGDWENLEEERDLSEGNISRKICVCQNYGVF